MAPPTEGGRAEEEMAVQLGKVKARIDEFHGDLKDTVDALCGLLKISQRLAKLKSASPQQGALVAYPVYYVDETRFFHILRSMLSRLICIAVPPGQQTWSDVSKRVLCAERMFHASFRR